MKNIVKDKAGQRGFTFVELAISMIIIGFLLVSILAGRAVIRQARLRSVIDDVNNYQAVFNLFTTKYNGMPGDVSDITNSLTGTSLSNGNGDTEITWNAAATCTGALTTCSEGAQAWYQLALAGMVPGTYTGTVDGSNTAANGTTNASSPNVPASKFAGGVYAFDYSNGTGGANDSTTTGNHLRFAAESTTGINAGSVISGSDAVSIDTKLDDGIPNTGKVQEKDSGASPYSSCTKNSGANYNTALGDTAACGLDIQLDSSFN